MSVTTLPAQDHAERLRGLSTQSAQVQYACEVLGAPGLTTAAVRTWLVDHGVDVERSYASKIVNVWRARNDLTSTGEFQALTPEMIVGPVTESTGVPVVDGSQVTPVTPAPEVPAVVDVRPGTSPRSWPVLLLALPAFVAIWSGWVGLGELTGFGEIHPLPGTPLAGLTLNTAITLPIGVETYAAYALRVWLSAPAAAAGSPAVRFARWSAVASLILGAAGQVAYHLMTAANVRHAPWWIVTVVACLPVAVLGMGAALAHLIRHGYTTAGALPSYRHDGNRAG